jgi:hypothetical protein
VQRRHASLASRLTLDNSYRTIARQSAPVTLIAVAAAAILALPAGASASLHECDIQATNTTMISSARDMSCQTAARETRRYRGNISTTFRTPGGFRCGRVSGGELGGQWRCTKGHQAFRFEFAD